MENDSQKKSSTALIAVAWLVVLLPAAWGLNYTVQSALKIFTRDTPPVTGSPAPAPAAK